MSQKLILNKQIYSNLINTINRKLKKPTRISSDFLEKKVIPIGNEFKSYRDIYETSCGGDGIDCEIGENKEIQGTYDKFREKYEQVEKILKKDKSPSMRDKSPSMREKSPSGREKSPSGREKSPSGRENSPVKMTPEIIRNYIKRARSEASKGTVLNFSDNTLKEILNKDNINNVKDFTESLERHTSEFINKSREYNTFFVNISDETIIDLLKTKTIRNFNFFLREIRILEDKINKDELYNFNKIFNSDVTDSKTLRNSLESGRSYGTKSKRKSNRDKIKSILLKFLKSSNNDENNLLSRLSDYVTDKVLREAYVTKIKQYKMNGGCGVNCKKKKTRRKKLKKTKRNRKKYTKKFTKKRKH